ncbi:MAG: c-type cytochrome biogenesis protein CcmI [Rhodospirillales bacterium]|nr:c-type cytochrome biogenesis protein CcmI [Rhodospirillales bacterium]MDE2199041.1 c-type cytochrome biogenesis protein CcmI [Rhodospirillales bacterium]
MIFLAIALLAAAALAPLALTLRHTGTPRGRQESALAVHRAQLAELDRDLAEGRIAAGEHASAVLEVQRRLLAAAQPEPPAGEAGRASDGIGLVVVALIIVPLAGFGLYLLGGHPELPAAPLAPRLAQEAAQNAKAEALIAQLRQRLAGLDQGSPTARQGYVLLGNAEVSLGHLKEAIAAWRRALSSGFDAQLAAEIAEAQSRLDGGVSPDSEALFRAALAAAPPDAPWRKLVEDRLAEAHRK